MPCRNLFCEIQGTSFETRDIFEPLGSTAVEPIVCVHTAGEQTVLSALILCSGRKLCDIIIMCWSPFWWYSVSKWGQTLWTTGWFIKEMPINKNWWAHLIAYKKGRWQNLHINQVLLAGWSCYFHRRWRNVIVCAILVHLKNPRHAAREAEPDAEGKEMQKDKKKADIFLNLLSWVSILFAHFKFHLVTFCGSGRQSMQTNCNGKENLLPSIHVLPVW